MPHEIERFFSFCRFHFLHHSSVLPKLLFSTGEFFKLFVTAPNKLPVDHRSCEFLDSHLEEAMNYFDFLVVYICSCYINLVFTSCFGSAEQMLFPQRSGRTEWITSPLRCPPLFLHIICVKVNERSCK